MWNKVKDGRIYTVGEVSTLRGTRYIKLKEDPDQYVWPPEAFVSVSEPISLRNVTLRGGKGQVSKVKKHRSKKERPISALIAIAGHTLALTFHEDGRFYPDFDSPIDLVNT